MLIFYLYHFQYTVDWLQLLKQFLFLNFSYMSWYKSNLYSYS